MPTDHATAALEAIARSRNTPGISDAQLHIAEAQVHATLALAAAMTPNTQTTEELRS